MDTNRLKTMFVRTMSIVVILAVTLSVTGSAFAQGADPRIVVSITGDWIQVENFAPGTWVNLSLYESQSPDAPLLWEDSRQADDAGSAFVGDWEHPVDLVPGNYLVVSDGSNEKQLILEPVSLDVLDLDADLLAGTSPAGRLVWVGTGNEFYGCSMDVISDPTSGAWEADFRSQPCDVIEDMWAAAQVFDEDGDATEANPPRNPTFTVFPEWDAVEGWAWPQDAIVHLEIDDLSTEQSPDYWQDEPVVPTPWNPNDVWVRFDFVGLYHVKPGDVVTLSDGAATPTHLVRNLAITAVDMVADTVAGTADVNEDVYVWPHATGEQQQVMADSAGTWHVDFSGIFDLVPSEAGRAEIRDEAGNATAVDWWVPNPRFTVFPEWEFVEGWDWPLGETVHLTVDDPGTEQTPDYQQDETVGFAPWDPNTIYVSFNFAGMYDLKLGDVVTLSDGTTRTHIVQNLAIIGVDLIADTVTGTATEGTTVHVWPHATGEQLQATADATGNWQVNFTGMFDLVAGEYGRSEIRDEFGNATAVDWGVPSPWLIAFPENDAVEGWEWPEGATVYLTIDNAPDLQLEGIAAVTTWGDPRTYVRFDFAELYDLKVGDVVTLTDNVMERTHVTQTLSVTAVNAADDTIVGSADPGAVATLWPHGFDQIATVQVTAGANGAWLADFATVGFNLVPGIGGRSEVRDEANNSTAVDWNVPVQGWEQVNDSGFGDPQTSGVISVEVFNDQLYAGVFNGNTGGQVWRWQKDGQWLPLSEVGFGSGSLIPGVVDLVVFQGNLYAGVGWDDAPGQIWRSTDGINWQPMTTDGFGDARNTVVTNFVVFKGRLYAGTGSTSGSAQIWRSQTGNSDSWTQVAPDGPGLTGNVTGFAVHKGFLYAAIEPVGSLGGSIQVWRSTNGSDWTEVVADGFGDPNNVSTGGFARFDGYLYLGTRNDATGAQLWRTMDGIHWEQVVGDGFGDLNNVKIESLFVYNDLLYAATYNEPMGLQIWRSSDGISWEQVIAKGFGDSNNYATLWNNATAIYQGHMLIGTWNFAEGGELWMFSP